MSWNKDNEVASGDFSIVSESTTWNGIELVTGNYIVRLVHSGFSVESEVSQ